MKTKQDNWQNFKYEEQRFLDTISRILSFKGNGGCVSVIIYGDKIHVTTNYFGRYNNNTMKWKPNIGYKTNFNQVTNDLNKLLVDKDISSFFEKVILDKVHLYHGNFNHPSEKGLIVPKNFGEYTDILENLYSQKINSYEVNSIKSYIRPMQDLLKIIHRFDEKIEFVFVENSTPSMHAEMKHYQIQGNKVDYYGLNKLSCNPCYSFIKDKCRGNHPINPNKWVNPDTGEMIDNQIIDKDKIFDEGQDLSDDEEFENKINIFDTTWHKFKKNIINKLEIVKDVASQAVEKILFQKRSDWIEGKQITDALKKELGEIKILSQYHEGSIDELVEVDSVEALKQILQKIKSDIHFTKGVMPLKVNGITKILNIDNQQTSHWVGVYIEHNNKNQQYIIQYVDPMGHPMSSKVHELFTELTDTIYQPVNGTNKSFIENVTKDVSLKLNSGMQYVCYDNNGIAFTVDSNINDCGAFVTHLLIALWNNKEIPKNYFNRLDSENLGQKLREDLGFTINTVKEELDLEKNPPDKRGISLSILKNYIGSMKEKIKNKIDLKLIKEEDLLLGEKPLSDTAIDSVYNYINDHLSDTDSQICNCLFNNHDIDFGADFV